MSRTERYAAFRTELKTAKSAYGRGELDTAFYHLENAHVLGQNRVRLHVLSHWWMLRIGLRQRNAREILGQLVRLPAALLFSRIWIPKGNTGGANVPATRPMPVRRELSRFLD